MILEQERLIRLINFISAQSSSAACRFLLFLRRRFASATLHGFAVISKRNSQKIKKELPVSQILNKRSWISPILITKSKATV